MVTYRLECRAAGAVLTAPFSRGNRATHLDRNCLRQNSILLSSHFCDALLLLPIAHTHPLLHGPRWIPEGRPHPHRVCAYSLHVSSTSTPVITCAFLEIRSHMSSNGRYCDCDKDSKFRKRSAPFTTAFLSGRSQSLCFVPSCPRPWSKLW